MVFFFFLKVVKSLFYLLFPTQVLQIQKKKDAHQKFRFKNNQKIHRITNKSQNLKKNQKIKKSQNHRIAIDNT